MKYKTLVTDIAAYIFIILFMYTAGAKFFTVKSFASTLSKSPLIGDRSEGVAWAIPIVEILISIMLMTPRRRITGLHASALLMATFTLYLAYMVLSDSKLPCNCGGVVSTMTWQQHIWFNLGFLTLAITAVLINNRKYSRADTGNLCSPV